MRIDQFESYLDNIALNHPIFQYDAIEAAWKVLDIWEHANYEMRAPWIGSVEVLVALLFKNCSGRKENLSPKMTIDALDFFQTYYYLRELLYYTHNFPRSIRWTKTTKHTVRLEFRDTSIPLQIWFDKNRWFVRSLRVFRHYRKSDETYSLVLTVSDQFKHSDALDEAFKNCLEEARLKLDNYESFLSHDLVFSSYSVGQLGKVYLYLTARGLLRRYFVRKNLQLSHGQFDSASLAIKESELFDSLSEATEIDRKTVEAILQDMSFDREKAEFGLEVHSFPLIYEPKIKTYHLFPHTFVLSNWFDSVRRFWAKKDPGKYGGLVAPVVDRVFGNLMRESFARGGFLNTKLHVNLDDYIAGLPDIDLLVASAEPDSMHVVLICELKSTLPESSAKQFVASAAKGGHLLKAKSQIKSLRRLPPQSLRSLLQKEFPSTKWGYGVYALRYLIITSQNIGTLVKNADEAIIDYETVLSALKVAKGDMAVLLSLLQRKRWIDAAGKCYEIRTLEKRVGSFKVEIPVVSIKSLLGMEQI